MVSKTLMCLKLVLLSFFILIKCFEYQRVPNGMDSSGLDFMVSHHQTLQCYTFCILCFFIPKNLSYFSTNSWMARFEWPGIYIESFVLTLEVLCLHWEYSDSCNVNIVVTAMLCIVIYFVCLHYFLLPVCDCLLKTTRV